MGGGGGGGVKSFSCQTQLRLCLVELWLGWGFDKNILAKVTCVYFRT